MVFKVVVIEEEDDTKQLRSFSHISNVCSEDSLRLVFYLTVWVSSFYSNKSPLLAHSIIFRPHLSSATLRPVPNTPLFSTSCSAYLTVENVVCFMIRAFCGPQDSYFFSFTVSATCMYVTVLPNCNRSLEFIAWWSKIEATFSRPLFARYTKDCTLYKRPNKLCP